MKKTPPPMISIRKRLQMFARIACFVEVIYDSRFSASTVNKIIENVGSAGNRVLQAFQIALELEQALDQFEVGSPN